jgi:hypothetical protein
MGQFDAWSIHMEGLHKIVKMKGGFLALNDAAKTKLRR